MDATFVDRAINVMEVISWTAIIIAMGLILLVIAAKHLCIALHRTVNQLVGTVLYCAPIYASNITSGVGGWSCASRPWRYSILLPTLFNSTGISMLSGNVPSDHASGLGASKKATVQNPERSVTKLL